MATLARVRFASMVACLVLPFATACSIISTFDGLTDGGVIGANGAARDASIVDTGVDAGVVDSGNMDACTPGETSCRPDESDAATTSLFECDNSHAQLEIQQCAYGCVTQDESDSGTSIPLCSPCFIGGYYCGGDKIGTDTSTLYVCNPDGTASVKQVCGPLGCEVNKNGKDDACK